MIARNRRRGVTLIELMVVVALISVLATIAYWGFAGVVPGYRLNAAARDAASLLVVTRARAISQNRSYIVEFQASGYRVIWDRTSPGVINVSAGNDEVTQSGTYGQGVTYFRPTTNPLPAGDLVVLDPKGLATNIPPDGLRIGLQNSDGRTREVLVRYSGVVRKL